MLGASGPGKVWTKVKNPTAPGILGLEDGTWIPLLICNRPAFYLQISDMQLHFQASEQVGISPPAAGGRISHAV